ncbi:MAG: hypothetical protein RMN24_05305 [Anaerolineae bacterium]|nr:glycoside hydrolase family 5 protein [Caldilineales bacterium]MCX7851890.1 glycoside hydrolase family 5 protein [Caldilineales bacterium]MDW8268566.1 hypothetical protein [Anaerolineae bacterium]
MKRWIGGTVLLVVLTACAGPAESAWPAPRLLAHAAGPADLTHHTIGVYLYPEDDVHGPVAPRLGALGARWSRSWLSWDWVEPVRTDPPTYRWEPLDAILGAARRAGLEPIFLLGGNASWAADSFCGPLHPDAREAFVQFLQAAVARYKEPPYAVRLWEIYNEPDSVFGPQGFCFGTRGHRYPETLRLAYEAIKTADPQALVLFGGLSYDFFVNEGGRFDPAFLDDALAAGAGPYFDILAFHYYPAFAERWQAFGPGVAGKAAYLRSELARYGLEKPLALTEIGRPTRGPDTDPLTYDEETTARFVLPALALARAADLAPIIWFSAVDKPAEPYDYGLFDADLAPEPGLAAYAVALAALQGAAYVGPLPLTGEGQALRFRQGERDVVVAWSGQPDLGTEGLAWLRLEATGAWVVNPRGVAHRLLEGSPTDGDGMRDGHLTLLIDAEPVVLWPF